MANELYAIKKDLRTSAALLEYPYEAYDIDELADEYCKAFDEGNEPAKDVYFSALVLRFWYKIYKLQLKSSGMELLTCYNWVADGVLYACKYRGWKKAESKLNAQQCINRCIETIRSQYYYDLNLDKNKTLSTTMDLDLPIATSSDGVQLTLASTVGESSNMADDYYKNGDVQLLIQKYVDDNKIIEAIMLDTIAYKDVLRQTKEKVNLKDEYGKEYSKTEYYTEFWPYQLVKFVGNLPKDYNNYFKTKYEIEDNSLSVALNVINKANNQKLYRFLDRTLEDAKNLLTTSSFTLN